MAKDPAILWYPSDYIGGTSDYTFEEKGAYMEILMKEFEHGGPLPEAKIKRILREKYHAIWEVIREKFEQDENGNWYNERLELERERRKKFTESRRNNLKKKNNPHKDSHMGTHTDTHTGDRMGNGSGNGIESEDGKGGGPGEVPRETRENEGNIDFNAPDVDGDEITFPIDTKPMRHLWAGWKEYRWKAHRARYPIMGEQADLKRLQGMTFPQVEKTILTAIANNWKNLYPENGKAIGNKKQQQSTNARDYLRDYYASKAGTGPGG